MQKFYTKKILIAPLDWGWGHTTRCITIIRLLLDNECSIIVACNSTQKQLLEREFNNIFYIVLDGYNINYSKNQKLFPFKLIAQLPKIIKSIVKEHSWLNKIIDEHKIELVISDNRYGLYTHKVPCVFITHQLMIKAPFGWLETLLQRVNYFHINRFAECWIPDYPGGVNIAGLLSHPSKMPSIPTYYIGTLARFKKNNVQEIKGSYCILLSGPEPQRTIFETQLINQSKEITNQFLLVRGKLNAAPVYAENKNFVIKDYLVGGDLQNAIQSAEYIISRSGYTSVMELLALQKKMILIPTPGQTEQEYLAEQLMKQQLAYSVKQSKLDLPAAIIAASQFNYQIPAAADSSLPAFIKDFLERI